MIVNDIHTIIENYKQLKKSFKVRESANYVELITSTGQKIYQNKSKRFTGGLYLFGMVKKDIQNYLEENGEVEPYEELPVNYINKEFDYNKDVIGMDINNAYWSVALLKGYISEHTYEKGLEKEGLKSIRLASLFVGVETITIFLFQNVAARFLASWIGSPSEPALAGYRSTSSQSTRRIGRDARPDGLLAPTSVKLPPGNNLCNVVFPLSLARGSFTLPLRQTVDLSNPLATRSFENA